MSINQAMADTGICICSYISIPSLGGLASKQTLKTTILMPETASEEKKDKARSSPAWQGSPDTGIVGPPEDRDVSND